MNQRYWVIVVVGMVLLAVFSTGCIESPSDGDELGVVVISGKGEYDSIQQAIDNASSGDSVVVYNGTYSEQLVLEKSVRLRSAENHSPVLWWNKSMEEDEHSSIVLVSANNCTVDGFSIRGSATIAGDVRGIMIDSDNNTISNNTIVDTTYGIYSYINKNNNIFSNKIRSNAYGMYLLRSTNTHVYRNTVSLNHEYGIYIHSLSDDNIVSHNTIMGNGYGMRIKGAAGNHVRWNIIRDNKRGVYCCCGSTGNMMYLNQFVNNSVWHAQDDVHNQWDNGSVGNYWDDYAQRYPEAQQVNNVVVGMVWDTPYVISDGKADQYPVVEPFIS